MSLFDKYKIVKHWNTPTEFTIRLYKREIPLLPFWIYECACNSVEQAEEIIRHKRASKLERTAYKKSIPKPTVEKYL